MRLCAGHRRVCRPVMRRTSAARRRPVVADGVTGAAKGFGLPVPSGRRAVLVHGMPGRGDAGGHARPGANLDRIRWVRWSRDLIAPRHSSWGMRDAGRSPRAGRRGRRPVCRSTGRLVAWGAHTCGSRGPRTRACPRASSMRAQVTGCSPCLARRRRASNGCFGVRGGRVPAAALRVPLRTASGRAGARSAVRGARLSAASRACAARAPYRRWNARPYATQTLHPKRRAAAAGSPANSARSALEYGTSQGDE